jgi:hypothetical protein
MIGNEKQSEVRKRMEELSGSPFYSRVLEAVRTHPQKFSLAADLEGLDLSADNEVNGKPNRARFKLFPLSTGRLAIFFYKPSLLHYSRDRFGYGGRVFAGDAISDDDIRDWLDFLAAGMPPDRRPDKLLRGFPYDVPP